MQCGRCGDVRELAREAARTPAVRELGGGIEAGG